MVSYYKTIPVALEESAYIDGATFIQSFTKIILPLAKPGLATIAMLQFINTWNEFYFALMLTSGDTARTVPIALNYYLGTFANNYSALFAAVIITVLPTIIIFIILQKQVNQRLFDEGEAVPEKAFTMGIKSIMQSKHILLIANGEKKAQIIRDAFFGPVTPKVPASILQLHNNVTVIVDKEAGKLIKDVL